MAGAPRVTGFRIETDRLMLREWEGDADWAAFFAHTNNPRVMRWLGEPLDAEKQALMRDRIAACD